jgi:hypothetical protein
MTANLWTVLISGRLRKMRGEILQGETPLSLTVFTRDCRVIKKRQITYFNDGRMQYVTIETHGQPANKIWINPPPMRPKTPFTLKTTNLCCQYSASIWGGLSAFASALSTP